MVGGARATVLGGSAFSSIVFAAELCGASVPVELPQAANTDGLAHVDVAGDGGGADVVPVDVLGRQLLGVCGLLKDARCAAGVSQIRTASLNGVDPACRPWR